mmetsp:Transcript_21193/g.41107  ORF Transcript_21193/g.41107 Transcript_21193/m.41107 type:complete len:146 (-) Transcript_21193:1644-2081(-)
MLLSSLTGEKEPCDKPFTNLLDFIRKRIFGDRACKAIFPPIYIRPQLTTPIYDPIDVKVHVQPPMPPRSASIGPPLIYHPSGGSRTTSTTEESGNNVRSARTESDNRLKKSKYLRSAISRSTKTFVRPPLIRTHGKARSLDDLHQ